MGLDEIKKQGERFAQYSEEQLLELAEELNIEIQKDTKEAERLEKQLEMIKQQIKEYKEASKKEGKRFEESRLYEEIIKFFEKIEERLEKVRIKNGKFLAFLYGIREKLKERKLKEFKRLKPE